MDMNARIRQYIKGKGMTFTFVADRAEWDIKRLSRFMTGRQEMTVDEYEELCKKGLQVDPSFFYQEKFFETKNSVEV